MAKKTVATLHEGSKDGRAYTKVIKMVKSPKTGAYIFDEQMVPKRISIQNLDKNKAAMFCCSLVFLYLCFVKRCFISENQKKKQISFGFSLGLH